MQTAGQLEPPVPSPVAEVTNPLREAFRQHQAALVNYTRQITGDLDQARDVVQDAFLRLAREDPPPPPERLLPWLFTVCRHRALDILRKERRMEPLDDTRMTAVPEPGPNPAGTAETREIAAAARPPCNLVFLIDVSGSMRPANKLPLLRQALLMLTERLRDEDRVAIVTYASGAQLALPSTSGQRKGRIRTALNQLQAGGSTHGSAGIQMAYQQAREHFLEGGVNRVILCTDGDFNVGITDRTSLIRLISDEARDGVFLTALGLGDGNYRDTTMEALADHGNGQYAYLDRLTEAYKVLVRELGSTLVPVAKDVKLQVEFNPAKVRAYRLIGYTDRRLRAEDFNDDRQDAGEIGAGHTVTALYEIVPPGVAYRPPRVDPLKYQRSATTPAPNPEPEIREDAAPGNELLTVKLRWKAPDAATSQRREFSLVDRGAVYAAASADFKFAAAVAAYGLILAESPYRGSATLGGVLELATSGLGRDREGYRADFLELVRQTQKLPWFRRRTPAIRY